MANGGRWIADNAEYREADGGIEAFGLEWTPGPGAMSMTGRLFGIRDGAEIGTFWNFQVFWHPGDDQAHIYQFGGDGTVGIGIMSPPDAQGRSTLEQTFFAPDGSARETRHANLEEPGRETGTSLALVDGEWVAQRTYLWIRQ